MEGSIHDCVCGYLLREVEKLVPGVEVECLGVDEIERLIPCWDSSQAFPLRANSYELERKWKAIHDNGRQIRQLMGNRHDLLRLLSTFTNTDLGVAVLQHVLAGSRVVCRIDSCRDAVCHPTAVECEEVLWGIETYDSNDVLSLKTDLDETLGHPTD